MKCVIHPWNIQLAEKFTLIFLNCKTGLCNLSFGTVVLSRAVQQQTSARSGMKLQTAVVHSQRACPMMFTHPRLDYGSPCVSTALQSCGSCSVSHTLLPFLVVHTPHINGVTFIKPITVRLYRSSLCVAVKLHRATSSTCREDTLYF